MRNSSFVEEVYRQLTPNQQARYLSQMKELFVSLFCVFVVVVVVSLSLIITFFIHSMIYAIAVTIIVVVFCGIALVPLYVICKTKNYKRMSYILGGACWNKIKNEKDANIIVDQFDEKVNTENAYKKTLGKSEPPKKENEETATTVAFEKRYNVSITKEQFAACSLFIYAIEKINTLLFDIDKSRGSEKYKRFHKIISNFTNSEIDDVLSLEILSIPIIYDKNNNTGAPFILEHTIDKTERNVYYQFIDNPSYKIDKIEPYKIESAYKSFDLTSSTYYSFIKNIGSGYIDFIKEHTYIHQEWNPHTRSSSLTYNKTAIKTKNFEYMVDCGKTNRRIGNLVEAILSDQKISLNSFNYYGYGMIWFAICYLIYQEKRDELKNKIAQILSGDNLSFDSELEDIIECFNKIALSQKDIFLYSLCACAFAKKDMAIITDSENIDLINASINKYKQKSYLKKLETGSVKKKYTLDIIDVMSGVEFEKLISEIFRFCGFETTLTPKTGDQGIDIVAKKGNTTIAIQAKRYNKSVGNHAIMEAVAGMKHYNADRVIVVTNNYFTESAEILAKENNVDLWNRNILSEKIEEMS